MEFTAILRGLSFRPIEAKAIAAQLSEGEPVLLEREPGNAFDPNAIMVLDRDHLNHLGYVAKEVAVELAPLMDEGRHFIARVESNMMKQIVLFITEVSTESDVIVENDSASE